MARQVVGEQPRLRREGLESGYAAGEGRDASLYDAPLSVGRFGWHDEDQVPAFAIFAVLFDFEQAGVRCLMLAQRLHSTRHNGVFVKLAWTKETEGQDSVAVAIVTSVIRHR